MRKLYASYAHAAPVQRKPFRLSRARTACFEMRIILSPMPRSCAPLCFLFFFFFARFAHAVTRRGHPDAASVEHALPQNDSFVRACDFAGEIGAQHARLSVRKNTSLSGAWHKFNSCLPGGFLSLTVTSHGHTTGRRVTGC